MGTEGVRDCGGVLCPFGGRTWQLCCSMCPCCGDVFGGTCVSMAGEKEADNPPYFTFILSLSQQREVCPQPSCGEGSGKTSLAHCTAAPARGGKSRGRDTKVTVVNALPLVSPTLSANRL